MKRKSLFILTGMSLALVGVLALTSPAMAQGRGGRSGPGNGAVSGPMLRDVIDRPALVAEALGITPAELQEAHAAGKTLLDLLDELGIDMATFRETLRELEVAAIDQAVADGLITPEQAERFKLRAGMRGRGGPGAGACEPGQGPGAGNGQGRPGQGRKGRP